MKLESILGGTGGGLRAEVVRGLAGSLLLKVVGLLTALALSIALARSLGPTGYGLYSYALALIVVLGVPTQAGLPTLLTREVARYDSAADWPRLRGVFFFSLRITLAISLAVAAVASAAFWNAEPSSDRGHAATFLTAFGLLPVIALINLLAGALRGLRHVLKAQLAETVVRPGVLLLLVAAAFWAPSVERTPAVALRLHVAAALVTALVSARWLLKSVPPPARTVREKLERARWLHSVWPLSLVAGAGAVGTQLDAVILGTLATPRDVGLYRVAVQGAMLVGFGAQALGMVVAPQIARLHEAGDVARLQRLAAASARFMFLTGLPAAVCLLLWGSQLLSLAFGAQYTSAHVALVILSVGQLIAASFGPVGYLLNMAGRERQTMQGFLVALLASAVLSVSLIPPFGFSGAAAASSISLGLRAFLLWRSVRRELGIRSDVVTSRLH